MIKADFFDSGSLAEVTIYARYLFIGMWVMADDKGNLKYQTLKLRKQIFPYDDVSEAVFNEWLMSLEDVGCICGYEVDGERYITIPNFLTYQNINRPSNTTIPEPKKLTDKHQIRVWITSAKPLTDDSLNSVCHTHDSEHSLSTHPERKKEGMKEESFYLKDSSSLQVDSKTADSGGGVEDHPPLPPEEYCGCPDSINPYKKTASEVEW